jgi:hypothetical protein
VVFSTVAGAEGLSRAAFILAFASANLSTDLTAMSF